MALWLSLVQSFCPLDMGLASRLTAYFRKKCVVVTDQRVRLMNEILGCIKFIQMYCWEDAFAQRTRGIDCTALADNMLSCHPESYLQAAV